MPNKSMITNRFKSPRCLGYWLDLLYKLVLIAGIANISIHTKRYSNYITPHLILGLSLHLHGLDVVVCGHVAHKYSDRVTPITMISYKNNSRYLNLEYS